MESNFFANEFTNYWNEKGHKLIRLNKKDRYESMYGMLSNCKTIGDIENEICSMTARKESTRRVMVDFLRYLGRKKGKDFSTVLADKKFYNYPFERQLEIAKFLHKPRTATEIEKRFDITRETRKKDLQALDEGIEVLGAYIGLEKIREGRKTYYKTSVHPVFLPLNLTEVYALTKYLPELLQRINDPNAVMINDVVDRIKSQLSDYAWEKCFPGERQPRWGHDYLSDEDLARSEEGIKMYLMKSGARCKFFWHDREYYGGIDRDGKIKLEDGSYLDADLRDVDFIVENLPYR